jgi:hypothetical protein
LRGQGMLDVHSLAGGVAALTAQRDRVAG